MADIERVQVDHDASYQVKFEKTRDALILLANKLRKGLAVNRAMATELEAVKCSEEKLKQQADKRIDSSAREMQRLATENAELSLIIATNIANITECWYAENSDGSNFTAMLDRCNDMAKNELSTESPLRELLVHLNEEGKKIGDSINNMTKNSKRNLSSILSNEKESIVMTPSRVRHVRPPDFQSFSMFDVHLPSSSSLDDCDDDIDPDALYDEIIDQLHAARQETDLAAYLGTRIKSKLDIAHESNEQLCRRLQLLNTSRSEISMSSSTSSSRQWNTSCLDGATISSTAAVPDISTISAPSSPPRHRPSRTVTFVTSPVTSPVSPKRVSSPQRHRSLSPNRNRFQNFSSPKQPPPVSLEPPPRSSSKIVPKTSPTHESPVTSPLRTRNDSIQVASLLSPLDSSLQKQAFDQMNQEKEECKSLAEQCLPVLRIDKPIGSPNNTNIKNNTDTSVFSTPSRPSLATTVGAASPYTKAGLGIGSKVSVNGNLATVRFRGRVHFADDDWVGLEFFDRHGVHDGSVGGQRYFDAAPGHGLFVLSSKLM